MINLSIGKQYIQYIIYFTIFSHSIDIGGRIQEVSPDKLYVTTLIATEGLLWVGTDQGLILTFPLPRLGGIPKVNGHACVSFHAHEGAVKTLYAFKVQKDIAQPLNQEPGILRCRVLIEV